MITEKLFISYDRVGTLKKDELYQLIKETKQGSIEARNKIIEHNIALVIYEVTNKFKNIENDKQDLVSIGILGLIKAIETFNIEKNIEFNTYAIKCIDNEILMFIRKNKKHNLIISLDRNITPEQSEEQVLTIEDTIYDKQNIEEEYQLKETYQIAKKAITKLSFIEKQVILLNFGFYNDRIYTQKEIAKILDLSPTTISKIKLKALYNICNTLKEQQIIISDKEITTKIIRLKKK